MNPADAWRSPDAQPFAKGRVGLHALLRAAGVGKGDEVLVPGFTCVVVPAAVQYTGARPVYYDAELSRFGGDPAEAAARIGERTRAVVVQHSFGVPCDLGELPRLCREGGILLVEDCAHAMGARSGGRPVGTLGDAAFASLQWSKPVSCGLGGLARTNHPALQDDLRELRDLDYAEPSLATQWQLRALSRLHDLLLRPSLYWRAMDLYRALSSRGLLRGSSSPAELQQGTEPPGYRQRFGRSRHGQLQAALDRLDEVLEHRGRIARLYRAELERRGVALQEVGPGDDPAHLRVPVLVRDRDALLEEARRDHVELGEWFDAPLHPREANAAAFGYREGLCPRGEWLAAHIINLPTHQRVDEREAWRLLAWLDERADVLVTREELAARKRELQARAANSSR